MEKDKLLTDVELELMTILWRLEQATVKEVISQLPSHRNLAYTSVSTILRILEQKGILKAEKKGRGHTYLPLLKKSEYEAKTLHHLVDNVFDGAPIMLAKKLLDDGRLKKDDIIELKNLLNNLDI